jgi:hypothetical protein
MGSTTVGAKPSKTHEQLLAAYRRGPKVVLWRYFDLAKFVSLISTNTLFFAAADRLGDEHEGALPTKVNNKVSGTFHRIASKMKQPANIAELQLLLSRNSEIERSYFHVSCWHMNQRESAAMWAQYGSRDGAVAIRSTVGRLRRALPAETRFGAVRYVDYADQDLGDLSYQVYFQVNHRLLLKRRSFEHEREYRAMIRDPGYQGMEFPGNGRKNPPPKPGTYVPVDLGTLIDSVHVSPRAPQFVADVVTSLCSAYGVTAAVRPSGLDGRPLF